MRHSQALTRSRIPATPALRDQRRLRPHALDALLIGLPVDGGDGGRALELEVAAALEVLLAHLEAEAQHARLETVVLGNELRQNLIHVTYYERTLFHVVRIVNS